ncbi:hypothetical protein [Paenibacillus sp. GCM10023250]|uniref:hypothetical protein n=1 Tax=Paenibacillus sp. GCM10023250 TaxID=3252648 RepID=UPI0036146435
MEYIYDKAINLNVTTYDLLASKGEQLINLFKLILDYIPPLLEGEFIIRTQKKSLRYVDYDNNKKSIEKFYASLIKGENLSIQIVDSDQNKNQSVPKPIIPLISSGVSCFDAEPIPEEALKRLNLFNVFTLGLSERLFNYQIPPNVQTVLLNIFKEAIQLLNGVTGYISYDTTTAGTLTPSQLENYYALDLITTPRYTERLRGYFWMTYLTERHLEQLGGVDYVIKNSPCFHVEPIKTDSHRGLILQLSPDINDYSDAQLLQLRTFLVPVLNFGKGVKSEGYIGYGDYPGAVNRLVEHLL